MELDRFRITHFRCLYDPGWTVFRNPTVLIGCNDGGKSATIEALDSFFGDVPPTADAYSYVPDTPPDSEGNRPREQEITLEAEFTVGSDEEGLLGQALLRSPAGRLHLRKVFRHNEQTVTFEMKMPVPEDPSLPSDPYSLNINEIRAYLSKLQIPNPGGSHRDPLLVALLQWLRQQPMKEAWASVPANVATLLPVYQVVRGTDPEETILQLLNLAHRQLLKEPKTEELLLKLRGEVEKHLTQPLEAKTTSLAAYISKYVPDIEHAYVNPQFKISTGLQSAPLTLVGRDGNRIDLSARGLGTRQQVTLAVFEWNSEVLQPKDGAVVGNVILAFDEPDIHLDYQAQRRVYEAIESYMGQGVQVIVATHSVNFINRVPIHCIHHYSKPPDVSQATIQCLSPSVDDPEEVAFFIDQVGEAMGLDNASVFYERCFLAFEGPTEQCALPILFKLHTQGDSLYRKGIKLVNCYDNYGAIVFAKFMNRNGRHVLFMVDEDTTTSKGTKRLLTESALEKAGFSVADQVHFVAPECFEYAFPDHVWARVLNLNQPGSKSDWSPEKVRTYRLGAKSFIESINKILDEDSKPKIGVMLAKAVESADEIPLAIRRCFDSAIELANQ